MLSGEVYNACDPDILRELNETKDRIWEYNRIRPTLLKERNEMLRRILGKSDEDTFIYDEQPSEDSRDGTDMRQQRT